MSQNTVSVVGPRSEQRQEKQPKKDPLDTILQGLQLAQGITGIAVNYQTIKQRMAENSALSDANAGIQPVKERQRAVEQGLQPVDTGTPGSQSFKYRQGEGDEGVVEQAFILPKKEVADKTTGAVKEVMGPNGSPILQYVTGKEEKPFTPYIKPEKEKPDTLSKVDYGKAAQSAGDKFRDDASKPKMAIDAANEAENLVQLARKNPAAAAAAVRKLARASGDSGVMSDADVNAFGGSQAMMDRFNRIFEKAANGTMTEDDVSYATEVAQTLKTNAMSAYDNMADDAVNRFQANFGGDSEDIYKRITGRSKAKPAASVAGDKTTKPESGTAIAAPGSGAQAPSIDAIQAELKRRGVK